MEMNKALFYRLTYDITMAEHERFNIGTYKEKKLHKILKLYFEEETVYHEVPCEGFIADVLKDGNIVEIETSGFSGLREKLEAYLPLYHVTLVHPLAAAKSVSWIDPETGNISQKRRSPKKENAYDLLFECIYILDYITHPNLNILGVCLEIQEYRMLDGWSRNKKRGSHRYEQIPTDIFEGILLSDKDSFAAYIPDSCMKDFTTAQFRKEAGINEYTARAVMKVLMKAGVIEKTGKKGNTILYSRRMCTQAED